MKKTDFMTMCDTLQKISVAPNRAQELKVFMCMCFLFVSLTDRQARELKPFLKSHFPDLYKEYEKPDENGFTAEFEYLRFK